MENWTEIILLANGMSPNLVRMYFGVSLCVESCQTDKKCLVTLFSDFSQFFPAWPIYPCGNRLNSNFLPDSEYLARFLNFETIKKTQTLK